MPHIDLYQIYGLDRRQPSETLAAQLTAQLNSTDPQDSLTRSRIDTARAILSDPQRRARYDAQLGDPAAPTLDEASLATIAGRPVPTGPRTGLAGVFAETKARILAAVVGVLALILVVAVTAVACSGSDGGSSTATDGAQKSSSQQRSSAQSSNGECELQPSTGAVLTRWRGSRPTNLIKIHKQVPLPAEIGDRLAAGPGDGLIYESTTYIRQYQDKTISVAIFDDDVTTMAFYRTDGTLVQTRKFAKDETLPPTFDLSEEPFTGYARVQADGVTLPSEAAGKEPQQQYALTVRPDAFDRDVVWVLLRGGKDLYIGTVYRKLTDGDC
ncbi:hypothetical protein nbrc107696_08230 [Gordonia spumicola]|uniref:J domain-containing protein n=1 Tax=Gordonia spumicola TaxID=589161 RepID=A0A7I9V554_9ACTN|nr:hypothetical protein [Gordonia spumicola]GEE00377.1 hypothetical protein nbrc107696_08230 [Gordonia spumicola]